jgi:tyramine---L-glutamate ligase
VLFVSEYLTCGAWAGDLPPSLLREGTAMFAAVAADFACVSGCRVVATRDARLPPADIPGVTMRTAATPADELRLFRELAAGSEATFVVAPEFDGILLGRRRLVDEVGGRFLGPSPETIEICGDKLQTFEHLRRAGLPTIATEPCDFMRGCGDTARPLVIKPRDGAGSELTFLVQSDDDFDAARCAFAAAGRVAIRQPFVSGTALSVGVICAEPGRIDVFPVGAQRLSDDGRFRYLGGRIPAGGIDQRDVESLVRRAVETLPDAAGYLGFDLILPADAPRRPLIVEINPRLTTSYLGYRRLTRENLAERMLRPERASQPIVWQPAAVEFTTDGGYS